MFQDSSVSICFTFFALRVLGSFFRLSLWPCAMETLVVCCSLRIAFVYLRDCAFLAYAFDMAFISGLGLTYRTCTSSYFGFLTSSSYAGLVSTIPRLCRGRGTAFVVTIELALLLLTISVGNTTDSTVGSAVDLLVLSPNNDVYRMHCRVFSWATFKPWDV